MAVIKSGAGATTQTIDPTSNAARVTLYDAGGLAINPAYGIYMLQINVVPTGFTSGGSYWAMRNTSGAKSCYLRRLSLNLSYWSVAISGAAAVNTGTRVQWDFVRFSGANFTTGSALTVIKRRNADPTSGVGDARQSATALTTTGATFETSAFFVTGVTVGALPNPATVATNTALGSTAAATVIHELDFADGGEEGRIQLAPGEGLAMRAVGTPLVNSAVSGTIWWDER